MCCNNQFAPLRIQPTIADRMSLAMLPVAPPTRLPTPDPTSQSGESASGQPGPPSPDERRGVGGDRKVKTRVEEEVDDRRRRSDDQRRHPRDQHGALAHEGLLVVLRV